MKPDLEIRTVDEPKRASRRPKTVVIKTVSTETGGKTKVLTLDANSASFGDDFLYVFTKNVKAARKKESRTERGVGWRQAGWLFGRRSG